MNYLDFFLLAEDNLYSLIIFSLVLTIIYLLIYRKYILSIFDPMFLIFLTSGLANAIVFYLFYLNEIRSHYFYSFLLTEFAFIGGFFMFKPISSLDNLVSQKIALREEKIFDDNFITILFYWASALHLFSQCLTYTFVGLPILMESRLTTYSGGSGFGIFGRLLDVSSAIGTFLLFYRIFYSMNSRAGKIYNYFYLFFVVFAMIVSGSKTNLLFLIYYLFILNIYMLKIKGRDIARQIQRIRKLQKILLISSVVLLFLVIGIQLSTLGDESNFASSLMLLGKRIVSFGDIYFLALPNDVIIQLHDKQGPLLQLFKDPLGMFRVIPWTSLPTDNGFAVSSYHYGDIPSGPNPRYNYFAMLYFGNYFIQMVYCFTIGIFVSFLRNKLFFVFPKHILFGVIYMLFSINIIYAFQDMPTMILKCTSIVCFLPLILVLSYFTMRLLRLYDSNF
ncbi:O-antigen polymerase [Pedobacter sp.]|jgi:hypothetical protein|uniref:O-antigen polymerase n=1 Tax=Pedobacter sp. TaxID=1411316 RepID=UPI002CA1536A|nr:O-antigen polymerase [Pedobacter sp.]HWW41766.1 O-antigen polymerase [Pedobacter sp.]